MKERPPAQMSSFGVKYVDEIVYDLPKKAEIIYKRSVSQNAIIRKPDNKYWRFRYYLNQYIALFCAFLIKPVVKLNHRVFRLKEGEAWESMFEIARMGLIIKEPEPMLYRFQFPEWISRNTGLRRKAFKHFRNIINKNRWGKGKENE